jgi:hypothetical protein
MSRRSVAPLPVAVMLLLSLTACGENPVKAASEPDAAPLPPQAVVLLPGFFTYEGEPLQLLEDGDPVPVRLAAQGGYAMFAGARILDLEPSPVRMGAALIDPTTDETLVSDTRTIETLAVPAGIEPDPQSNANFLHLVACPNYGTRMVHGLDWTLKIWMDDPRYEGSVTVRVVPKCNPGSRFLKCLCECEPGYYFAKCGAAH